MGLENKRVMWRLSVLRYRRLRMLLLTLAVVVSGARAAKGDTIDFSTGYTSYGESCYFTTGIGESFVPQQMYIVDASILVGAASNTHYCQQALWQDAHVEIRSGVGGALLFRSSRVDFETLPNVGTLGSYAIAEVRASSLGLTQPISVTPGALYSVVLVNDDVTCSQRIQEPSFGTDVYAAGSALFRTCSGTWSSSNQTEFAFRVQTADPTTPGNWTQMPAPPRYGAAGVCDARGDRMIVLCGAASGNTYSNAVWSLALGDKQSWIYQPCQGAGPSPRSGITSAYDPQRNRVYLYGGVNAGSSSLDEVWSLDLSGSLTWTQILATGVSPGGGTGFTSIYDGVRDRLLVIGGTGFCHTPEVWELNLSGAPAWTKLSVSGTPPSRRTGEVVAYDQGRDRLLLFGGESGLCIQPRVYYNDLWSLSLAGVPTWTQLVPSGLAPTGRASGRAAYDIASDRLILLNPNSLWAVRFSGAPAWEGLSPSGNWPVVQGGAAILDQRRGELVVYGGLYSGATRTLSLAAPTAWIDPRPNGATPPLSEHPLGIFDPLEDRLVVWSGYGISELSMNYPMEWANVAVVGAGPTSVREACAVYDPVRRRMVVFGGYNTSNALQSVAWFMTMSGSAGWNGTPEWGIYTALAAVGRAAHSGIYDPNRDAMLVFGGAGGGSYRNDVVALNLAFGTWSTLGTSGPTPHARYDHTAIYDPVRNRMLIFGGAYWDGVWHLYNDVWALSLSGAPTWSLVTPAGSAPRARFMHSAIYDPTYDRMVVHGGSVDSVNFVDDTWELRLSGTPTWQRVVSIGDTPCKRYSHVGAFDPGRGRMLLFGGIGSAAGYNGSALNDAWSLSYGTITTDVTSTAERVPFQALRAAPTPTRSSTTVYFTVPTTSNVELRIFDVAGRAVRTLVNRELEAGAHAESWDGKTTSGQRARPGLYLCQLRAPFGMAATRIVLIE